MTESAMEKTPDQSEQSQAPSLMKRVIRSSIWTLGGHIANQFIRLVSNLIVTRLLFPEAFGLMALVYTCLAGLEMLSDTGVNQCIIQSKRGDDPKFLNTGFTAHVIRGIGIWLMACSLSWVVADFYHEPSLRILLPVAALTNLMTGVISTKHATASRHLALGRITTIDLTSQIVGIVLMIACAWVANVNRAPKDVAVWALVVAALVSTAIKVTMSHTYLPGISNRFEWDKEAAKEFQKFGGWILVSTLMGFFVMQGNNLVIPKLIDVKFLGVFSIAQNLSRIASEVIMLIGSRVFFPSYAELFRDRPERLYKVVRRSRAALNAINVVVCLFFVFFGQPLVRIMYDIRYADAGWILQLLAIGMIMVMPGSTYTNVLMAQGKTFAMTIVIGLQAVLMFACMLGGYYFGGQYGLIVGVASVGWVLYPFQAIFLARFGIWQPEIDIPVLALGSGVATLIFFHLV